jgi:signal transduction histidine kinase
MAQFTEAMDDDFNTAAVIGHLYEAFVHANKLLDDPKALPKPERAVALVALARDLREVCGVLGIAARPPSAFLLARRASRGSSGVKELIDINAMVHEYLRLAYHGLRAKDKSFNVALTSDFDEKVGTISLVSQDIGRVILNLINNAFYAVNEKKKQSGHDYEPLISVSTKRSGNNVLISAKDNGIGIPQNILDKIFQPFFTTKPTGQGTGLGLSLSYDIVKAHGGEFIVDTREGEGSEFIIVLPIT